MNRDQADHQRSQKITKYSVDFFCGWLPNLLRISTEEDYQIFNAVNKKFRENQRFSLIPLPKGFPTYLKEFLGGKSFATEYEVKEALQKSLSSQVTDVYNLELIERDKNI